MRRISIQTARWTVTGLCCAALIGACGAESGGDGSGNGSGGPGSSSDPFGSGADGEDDYFADDLEPGNGNDAPTDVPASDVCGQDAFDPKRVPGELLLVLDRSGSMREPIGRRNFGSSKWQAVTSAIDTALASSEAEVSWGLSVFPNSGQCGAAGPPEVAVQANNRMAILEAIDRRPPQRNLATPTRFAIEAAAENLAARSSPNPKYILLATDGQPNCLGGEPAGETTDASGAVAAVEAASMAGFKVFVLGIAVGDDAGEVLNAMALAGGVPRAGAGDKYYPAQDEDQLAAALEDIAGQVTSCTLTLSKPPPSPDYVGVEAISDDDTRLEKIPRDDGGSEGWSYGPDNRSVLLHGRFCDSLKANAFKVRVVYGCPANPVL